MSLCWVETLFMIPLLRCRYIVVYVISITHDLLIWFLWDDWYMVVVVCCILWRCVWYYLLAFICICYRGHPQKYLFSCLCASHPRRWMHRRHHWFHPQRWFILNCLWFHSWSWLGWLSCCRWFWIQQGLLKKNSKLCNCLQLGLAYGCGRSCRGWLG